MIAPMLSGALRSEDFVDIFIVSLSIALAQVVTRYITKLRSSPEGYEKEDHFECCRFGVDLAFIGFVAGLGSLRALIKQIKDPSKSLEIFNGLVISQSTFLAIQVALLLAAILFTSVFYDWSQAFYRGIFVPDLIGILSILLSAALFLALIH